MRDRLDVARRSLHAHHIRFLSGRRRHQRCQHRSPVTAAALAEFESGEPQLIAAFERAKEPESDRRQAAVPIVGPEDVAGNGDRLDSSRSRVLLDEIAGDERPLELFEEIRRFVTFGGQLTIEASFRRPFANQRSEEREVADMSGLKHEGLTGAVCKTVQGNEYRMRASWTAPVLPAACEPAPAVENTRRR